MPDVRGVAVRAESDAARLVRGIRCKLNLALTRAVPESGGTQEHLMVNVPDFDSLFTPLSNLLRSNSYLSCINAAGNVLSISRNKTNIGFYRQTFKRRH